MAVCWCCGEEFPNARKVLGYNLCLVCNVDYAKAESEMKFSMVIPSNKSTPTYISNPELLKQLNPKRTT
jgi:hypothetical protein